MQKDSQWVWGTPQQQAFEEIKSILTAAPVLALYDPNKDTKVSADASSFGLGGVLLQKQDQTWRPVMFISRALTLWNADMRKQRKRLSPNLGM